MEKLKINSSKQYTLARITYLHIVLIFFPYSIISQSFQSLDVEVFIDGGNTQLAYPSLGNLVAPQFSEIDFNGDEKLDLFVFDRDGNVPLSFINNSTEGEISYVYDPILSKNFPKVLHSWALMRDYNNDGVYDIFTAPDVPGIPGIQVYKGVKNGDEIFYEPLDHEKDNFYSLSYPSGDRRVIIYVAFSDLPGIEDIDGDGDIDIVSFDPGGSIANYYKNFSVERGFGLDTFILELEDLCFGKFKEDEFSSEISLSESPNTCAIGIRATGTTRHSGSTMSFPDINRDGTLDILLGDLTSNKIALLNNTGTSSDAWMTSLDLNFPSYGVPIILPAFVSTFMIDVDGDDKKDLIAAPNNRLTGQSNSNIWLYKDIGVDTAVYDLIKKDFLIDESLVLGASSHPALLDIDGDSDLDLLVGVSGLVNEENNRESTIYLFENISDAMGIKYKLIDDNYLNIKELNSQSGRYAPSVGDLDGDGDLDLLVGDKNGKLIYYENEAGMSENPVFKAFVYNYKEIGVGQNAKPQIIDLDEDGLADIVVGERNDNKEGDVLGGLNFFKNIGEAGNPDFKSESEAPGNTSVLAGIFTRDAGFSVGSSSPFFIKTGDDFRGFIGSESGQLKHYTGIKDNLYQIAGLVTSDVLPFKLGKNSTVVGADLNNNEFIDFIVGSSRGTVAFFESTIKFDGGTPNVNLVDLEVDVFPNPSNGRIFIKSDLKVEKVSVYNMGGQLISSYLGENDIVILNAGMYLLQIHTDKGLAVKKVVVE